MRFGYDNNDDTRGNEGAPERHPLHIRRSRPKPPLRWEESKLVGHWATQALEDARDKKPSEPASVWIDLESVVVRLLISRDQGPGEPHTIQVSYAEKMPPPSDALSVRPASEWEFAAFDGREPILDVAPSHGTRGPNAGKPHYYEFHLDQSAIDDLRIAVRAR